MSHLRLSFIEPLFLKNLYSKKGPSFSVNSDHLPFLLAAVPLFPNVMSFFCLAATDTTTTAATPRAAGTLCNYATVIVTSFVLYSFTIHMSLLLLSCISSSALSAINILLFYRDFCASFSKWIKRAKKKKTFSFFQHTVAALEALET